MSAATVATAPVAVREDPARAGREWANWSGSLRFAPRRVATPESEDEVAALVRRAREEGRRLRPVGCGHSSSPLVRTDDTLVSLERIHGLASHDAGRGEAAVRAGTVLEEMGPALLRAGLGMPNYGDVATQALGGAVGTGTHGTGRRLTNLSGVVVGGRLVSGTGEVVAFGEDTPDLLSAARVALGALGIFTELRLRLLPVYTLERREWCTTVGPCLAHLDELVDGNRSFDFYWYPRSDEVKLRLLNPPGGGTTRLPWAALVEHRDGWAHSIIPKHSGLPYRFDEMEYALPLEAGPACFRAVRDRVRARWRSLVAWRVLYRTVAADDADLSPCHGRETAYLSLHQNSTLPYWDYFRDLEPVLRDHGGRPHWGKLHTLGAAELRPLYPRWDAFLAVRERLDPDGVFLSPDLRALLGVWDGAGGRG